MTVAIARTVRELALEDPSVTRVFEKLGIDYCCSGNISLEQACRTASLDIDQVVESLEKAHASPVLRAQDWQIETLGALIAHIQSTHHKYTREEITRLGPLFEKVCTVHGKNHPELLWIHQLFQDLAQELTAHMMKEEMILFPYIARMEAAVMRNEPIPRPPFGSVQNPVSMMEHEHDSAGNALRAMREASNGYSAPADACVSFQALYRALAEFEGDLHQHIHLENNILFPRAIAIESAR
jgi:regulator of cell morphogenesis and NO signaling